MKERALQKMLQDFPWLWGIYQFWNPQETAIEVHYVKESMFEDWLEAMKKIDEKDGDFGIWIKRTIPGGLEDLIKMDRQKIEESEKITAANTAITPPTSYHCQIEYIALASNSKNKGAEFLLSRNIIIIRPPKNQTFQQFFEVCLKNTL